MADTGTSGTNTLLAVIIGAILVLGVAFFAFGGLPNIGKQTASVNVTTPAPTPNR